MPASNPAARKGDSLPGMEKRRQMKKPRNRAIQHTVNMVRGTQMLLTEYSAVAKAENMTAGRAISTATFFSAFTPSRVSRFFFRHRTPRNNTRNTGRIFCSKIININPHFLLKWIFLYACSSYHKNPETTRPLHLKKGFGMPQKRWKESGKGVFPWHDKYDILPW